MLAVLPITSARPNGEFVPNVMTESVTPDREASPVDPADKKLKAQKKDKKDSKDDERDAVPVESSGAER